MPWHYNVRAYRRGYAHVKEARGLSHWPALSLAQSWSVNAEDDDALDDISVIVVSIEERGRERIVGSMRAPRWRWESAPERQSPPVPREG